MFMSLYFPVTCNPSRAVTLPNIGVPHYIGVAHRVTYPYHTWYGCTALQFVTIFRDRAACQGLIVVNPHGSGQSPYGIGVGVQGPVAARTASILKDRFTCQVPVKNSVSGVGAREGGLETVERAGVRLEGHWCGRKHSLQIIVLYFCH